MQETHFLLQEQVLEQEIYPLSWEGGIPFSEVVSTLQLSFLVKFKEGKLSLTIPN